jgi:hypothetical protein
MTAAYLIFIAIACAPLVHREVSTFVHSSSTQQGSAERSPKVTSNSPQSTKGTDDPNYANGNRLAREGARRVGSNGNRQLVRPSRIKNNHARRMSENMPRSTSEHSSHLGRVNSASSPNARSNPSIREQRTSNPVPIRPGVARPRTSSLSAVRHHSENPAIVNGSSTSVGKNAGVLDGTRMNRKL